MYLTNCTTTLVKFRQWFLADFLKPAIASGFFSYKIFQIPEPYLGTDLFLKHYLNVKYYIVYLLNPWRFLFLNFPSTEHIRAQLTFISRLIDGFLR